MPWKEVNPMQQRLLFISDHLRQTSSVSDLCRSYGISRKTGYKWIRRYQELHLDGLNERSSQPHTDPIPHSAGYY